MIELKQVSKSFHARGQRVNALHPTDLTIEQGEVFGLLGFSGAGKSTLLRLINRLEEPSSGSVRVDGREMVGLAGRELAQARQRIGMIFQQFNLLSHRSALGNVEFALEVAGTPATQRRQVARDALAAVGLSDKENAFPAQLSGGQRQRVAIARALSTQPTVLLCDEATSALDPHTALSILRLLRQLNRDRDMTIVMVTHDIKVANYMCQRCMLLEKGQVVDLIDMAQPQPQSRLGKFFFETAKGWTDETELPQEET
ncbi:MAG: ATP-binding cassette domain-containing protein [Pseudomonadota bacterium]